MAQRWFGDPRLGNKRIPHTGPFGYPNTVYYPLSGMSRPAIALELEHVLEGIATLLGSQTAKTATAKASKFTGEENFELLKELLERSMFESHMDAGYSHYTHPKWRGYHN